MRNISKITYRAGVALHLLDASDSPVEISLVHSRLQVDESRILRLVDCVCAGERVQVIELSIVLADHATVRELNQAYLDHDYDTDVLSFPLRDAGQPGIVDGEIYVDLDTAFERHAEFEGTFEEETLRYITHGLLHLIGYEDDSAEKKAHMHTLENRYLSFVIGS